MSPVDSIRPPSRAKKITPPPSAPAPRETVPAEKNITMPDESPKNFEASLSPATTSRKQKTIVMIVVVIMALIFISWVALFMGGKLTRSSASNFGSVISSQLKNLWQTIKTDILKIKNTDLNANSANVNDEQIKKLENAVFPQFNDPTKQ
ncbi:MAG: hypothetical protein V1668_01370 [Patescibacteria group bacterium]